MPIKEDTHGKVEIDLEFYPLKNSEKLEAKNSQKCIGPFPRLIVVLYTTPYDISTPATCGQAVKFANEGLLRSVFKGAFAVTCMQFART